MFKYFLFVFMLWYQIRRYGCVQSVAAPIAAPLVVLDAKKYNFSEVTEEWKKKPGVAMSGQNNYHVGQQVFYIYNEQQLKRLLAEDGTLSNYYATSDIGMYKFHQIKATWNNARKTCIEDGGHLAVINSAEEEQVLLGLLRENRMEQGWIGLHDIFQEGDWVSVTDVPLAHIGYVNWTTAWADVVQPDGGREQNCANLVRYGGIDDRQCDFLASFFCEMPV